MAKRAQLVNASEFEVVSKVIPGRPIKESKNGVEFSVTFFNRNKKGFEYTIDSKTVTKEEFDKKYTAKE